MAPVITKTSRNDPCPCGSGNKYKKCCLLNDLPSLAAQTNAQLNAAMAGQDFESMTDMQAFLDQQVTQMNNECPDEFNGLSPNQVHQLLNFPLEEQDLLGWQPTIDESVINQTPIMQLVQGIISLLHEAPIRATANGR
jgi:hypothetical protein